MKNINSVHIVRLAQVLAIAYSAFVILSDIMKWERLDDHYTVLVICIVATISGIWKKQEEG